MCYHPPAGSMGFDEVADPLAYYAAYLLPATVLLGYYYPDWAVGGTYFTVVFAYGVVPVAEASVSLVWPEVEDTTNAEQVSSRQLLELGDKQSYRVAVLLWPLVQFSLLFWCLTRPLGQLDSVTFFGLAVSMGFVAAGGINVAHELFHKPIFIEKLFGRALLASVAYGHFALEHSKGHHRNVATPRDPATARFGEGFYEFLPRTVVGGFLSAWRLGGGFSLSNEVIYSMLVQSILAFLMWFVFGQRALCFWIIHALVGVTLLEKINFIEHYGLQRKKLADGSYECVGPQHSWDAPQRVTNLLLFKLQRHADHHKHCRKKYQTLQGLSGSPQLPFGYATLAVIALLPPLWKSLMHTRVKAAE